MAIRKVNTFKTESDFFPLKRSLPYPSISHIKETGETYFATPYRLSNVGDIVLYDDEDGERIYVYHTEYNAEKYPLERYIPIGVVVIPERFTPDGQARMMSLVNMDCTNPSNGKASNNSKRENRTIDNNGDWADDIYIKWGAYHNPNWVTRDIEELPNYGDSSRAQKAVLPSGNYHGNSFNYGYLPSDKFTKKGFANYADPLTAWVEWADETTFAPGPYTKRWDFFDKFGEGVSKGSMLSDMDGSHNTDVLINEEQYQPNWETDERIENWYYEDYLYHFPAALCCRRFMTADTSQGDWYLPAMGELAFLMPRWNIIQSALKAVQRVSASVAVPLDENNNYWSSSEYSQNNAYSLLSGNGYLNIVNKDDYLLVRAFCLLPRI